MKLTIRIEPERGDNTAPMSVSYTAAYMRRAAPDLSVCAPDPVPGVSELSLQVSDRAQAAKHAEEFLVAQIGRSEDAAMRQDHYDRMIKEMQEKDAALKVCANLRAAAERPLGELRAAIRGLRDRRGQTAKTKAMLERLLQ